MKTKYAIVSVLLISLMITFIGCGKSDNSNTKVDDTNKNVKQVQYQDAPKAGDIGIEQSNVDTTVTTTTPTTTQATTTTAQTSVTTTGTTAPTIPTLGLGETFTYSFDNVPLYNIKITEIKESNYRKDGDTVDNVPCVFVIYYEFTKLSTFDNDNLYFACYDSQNNPISGYACFRNYKSLRRNEITKLTAQICSNTKISGNIKIVIMTPLTNNSKTVKQGAIFNVSIQ